MRHFATHWIVETSSVTTWTQKLRPFLRALYPEATESMVGNMASWVSKAGDEGHIFHYLDSKDQLRKVRVVRREGTNINADMVKYALGDIAIDPFTDDIDQWMGRFEGRKCHGGV